MSNINNIEVVDPKEINTTETIAAKAFKTNLQRVWYGCNPKLVLDDDGNIEAATVAINGKIHGGDLIYVESVAEDYDLVYSISPSGTNLIVEFNK